MSKKTAKPAMSEFQSAVMYPQHDIHGLYIAQFNTVYQFVLVTNDAEKKPYIVDIETGAPYNIQTKMTDTAQKLREEQGLTLIDLTGTLEPGSVPCKAYLTPKFVQFYSLDESGNLLINNKFKSATADNANAIIKALQEATAPEDWIELKTLNGSTLDIRKDAIGSLQAARPDILQIDIKSRHPMVASCLSVQINNAQKLAHKIMNDLTAAPSQLGEEPHP